MQKGSGRRSCEREAARPGHGLVALRCVQREEVPTSLDDVAAASGVGRKAIARWYRLLVTELI